MSKLLFDRMHVRLAVIDARKVFREERAEDRHGPRVIRCQPEDVVL